MGCFEMKKTNQDVEKAVIGLARENVDDMLNILVEIAKSDPPTHVSVKAAEAVIKLSREQTPDERNPFGICLIG